MNIKAFIKNDLTYINYIVPFVKKYKNMDESIGKLSRRCCKTYFQIKPSKGKTVVERINDLLEIVDIKIDINKRYIYHIDQSKTIAVRGKDGRSRMILKMLLLAYFLCLVSYGIFYNGGHGVVPYQTIWN